MHIIHFSTQFVRGFKDTLLTLAIVILMTVASTEAIAQDVYSGQLATDKNKKSSLKWDNNRIFVCFRTFGFDKEKQWVLDALAKTWESHSKVRFDFNPRTCDGEKHGIPKDGHHYLFICIRDGVSFAQLGRNNMGIDCGMHLNFTFKSYYTPEQGYNCSANELNRRNCIEWISVHEFGHALGFAHEHARSEGKYQCPQAYLMDRELGYTDAHPLTEKYDEESVMNYCKVWSMLGLAQIPPVSLSDLDKYGVGAFYN